MRRLDHGGRVCVAVRRARTELWLFPGAAIGALKICRLDRVHSLGHWSGGPSKWDWMAIGNILIRPHDNHAARPAIDSTSSKDILTAFDIGAEGLLIIEKAETSFFGEKERRHRFDGEFAMSLLEYGPDIDDRVDVLTLAGIFPDRRVLVVGEKIAQPADG